MTNPFVWFHNSSEKPAEVVEFYEKFLGWKGSEGPGGMSMFSGEAGPFAGVAPKGDASQGWIPYVQVDNVERATESGDQAGRQGRQDADQWPSGRFHHHPGPGRGGARAVAESGVIPAGVSSGRTVGGNTATFCHGSG